MRKTLENIDADFVKTPYEPMDNSVTIKRSYIRPTLEDVRGLLSSVYRGLVDESIIFPNSGSGS